MIDHQIYPKKKYSISTIDDGKKLKWFIQTKKEKRKRGQSSSHSQRRSMTTHRRMM
jgi:hypothetical protein